MAEVREGSDQVEWLGDGGGQPREGGDYDEYLSNLSDTEPRVGADYVEYLYIEEPGPPPDEPDFQTFHSRRGSNFEVDVSFRLPADEKLFDAPTLGQNAPADADDDYSPPHGYDEALDECTIIVQKGGDRTAPMSWALGIVNIGEGVGLDVPADRPSNYALVWMWFDAPGWGQNVPASMMYNLTSGEYPSTGDNAQYSTQAFRAVLIHKFIEPGRRYNVAVQIKVDSGSPGDLNNTTVWNEDGYFAVWVSTDGEEPEVFSANKPAQGIVVQGMEVYKGPQDSIDYLTKYGIRYSSRDAIFWGLGFRSHVWKKASFIPWGADAAPIQFGGYRMIDRTRSTVDDIYGAGVHTLTMEKGALLDPYVTINHRGFAASNTNGGTAPMGFWGGSAYLEWAGLNAAGVAGSPFNPEALRGYRLVTTADFVDGTPTARGMVLNIESYDENAVGGRYPVTITDGTAIEAFAESPVLVQAFRWHQRPIETCELRIWSEPRDYADFDEVLAARRKLSLRSGILLDDSTEPDIETLRARWAGDDAGGSVLREAVVGGRRAGYLGPFGLGVSEGGTRGPGLLYLSGEGEAVTIDFSENPAAKRWLEQNQGSHAQGLAVEITCIFPEASYAIQGPGETLPDGGVDPGSRPRFVSDILTWDVPDPDDSGAKAVPRTIISLTHRGLRNDQNQLPFTFPVPWSVEVATRTDQEDVDPVVHSDLLPWYLDGAVDTTRYATDAPWVGKPVTIQVGIQPTGTDDEYDVYVAMRPKSDIFPEDGDSGDSEFAYWSDGNATYDENPAYFTSAHITIRKRDLARSVITIGGRRAPKMPAALTAGLGYSELNARILLDEVRVFGTAAPGALPDISGEEVSRDGKLLGQKCLPARLLTQQDILQPLGRGLTQVNVTEGSTTVLPAGGGKFFTSAPEDSKDSVQGCALIVRGDTRKIEDPDTIGKTQEDFYRIASVATDGSSLELSEPFRGATRSAAAAAAFRLLFYSGFEDDLSEKPLSLGAGSAYNPTTSTVEDAVEVDDLWVNVGPISVNAGLRIYSPLGRGTVQDILPSWCRGLVRPRRNPILGITGRGGDIYCGVQGALYLADDRWSEDTPRDEYDWSLRFRGTGIRSTGLSAPLHDDRVVFQDASTLTLTPGATDEYVTVIDAWVKLDEIREYQTILWVGDLETDPALDAGSHRVHLVLRLRYGTPELVVGSIATPAVEKGLYIASGSTAIAPGVWSHVRWYLPTRGNGATWLKPHLKVNGKRSEVTLNAQDSGISGLSDIDWIDQANVVAPGVDGRVILGASRDSYRAPEDNPELTEGVDQLRPQRIQGFLHSLQGLLGEATLTRETPWTDADLGEEPDDFDPFAVTFTLAAPTDFRVLATLGEGVGNKVLDFGTDQYGLIHSSPFVSLFHEFGRETNTISWAQFGTQLYATNGGRPVVVIGQKARFAGVLPPTTKPEFEVQRFPVWTENVRDKTTATGTGNDPIDAAVRGAEPVNHYRSSGNSFFRQRIGKADAEILDWQQDRYFGFKCFWRPRATAGRINLWRRGQAKDAGGPFVECRDGKLAIGWYDTGLKKEVYVETSSPVFFPGRVHYVYVRKRFPQNDALEGNWQNSYFAGAIYRVKITTPVTLDFVVGETITGGTSTATGRVLKVVQATTTEDGFIEYVRVSMDFTDGETITGGTSTATATANTPIVITRPCHDLAIVRVLREDAPTALTLSELDEVDPDDFPNARNSLGFTAELAQARPVGTVATGQVGHNGNPFSTNVANPGRIVGAGSAVFHGGMEGMYFQFGDGDWAGKLYRIVTVTNATTIETVIAGTNTPEAFTTATDMAGGIFMGIGLVKSDGFDDSRSPDSNGDVEFLGTSLQKSSLSGFAPHDGEMWCPGWTMVDGPGGENPQVFEDDDRSFASGTGDPIDIGTDTFDDRLFDGLGGEVGELHYNGTNSTNEDATPTGATFWATDARTYNDEGGDSSSQPNGTPTRVPFIDKDPTGTHPYTVASRFADPTLVWIQQPSAWSRSRFVTTAFYDPLQDAVSNGGPVLTIAPSSEDPKNPSGAVRILLTGLPQRRDHELWVFESLSGSLPEETPLSTPAEPPETAQPARRAGRVIQAVLDRSARANAELEAELEIAAAGLPRFPASAAIMLRVARFEATAYETAIKATEETLGEGPPLSWDNHPPPSCKVIASTGTRLFYGCLTKLKQLDGVMYSRAGAPVSLRLTPVVGFFRVASGRGDEITGLLQLDELVVIAKDLAIASCSIGADDLARVETVSSGTGAVSPASLVALDDRGHFLGDRGVHLVSRTGVTNLGRPVLISTALENYFASRLDRRYARGLVAAVNRARDQYVLLTREEDETYQRHRLSMEQHVIRGGAELQGWNSGSFRFSRYLTPNLTAIGHVQAGQGARERFVGGTLEGFMVWLDRSDTQGMLLGDTAAIWGDQALVADSGSTVTSILVASGTIDTDQEGPRGATVRYLDAGGTERSAVVLGAASGLLLLDDEADAAVPLDGDVLVGVLEHRWETGWLDCGNPERNKLAHFVNLVTKEGATGTLRVELFSDFDSTTVKATHDLDLSLPHVNIPQHAVPGHHFKIKLSVPFLDSDGDPITGTAFDIAGIVLRYPNVDQD